MDKWNRYQEWNYFSGNGDVQLDISKIKFSLSEFNDLSEKLSNAIDSMEELDSGAIANPDENRMVGHYWLRDSSLAPSEDIKKEIDNCLRDIKLFVSEVHSGKITNSKGEKFESFLLIGIGGSALGPQLLNASLDTTTSKLNAYFIDNTDPDGMRLTLNSIPDLSKTLVLVTSKSGGTKETKNGQILVKEYFKYKGIDISSCFVAVTGKGSELDKTAAEENWLKRFPMWDWVGGRTSLWSAVGLLPAALQEIDIDELLAGAKAMDILNREKDIKKNPAALLAFAIYKATNDGAGERAMVMLPYKDRLSLFSKYLQQLVMESLGKKEDLDGATVNQGISVFGNKGSTDQHAYIQQLRDGLNNFFVVFIEVLNDDTSFVGNNDFDLANVSVVDEDKVTAGDYLSGFYQGTRKALFESDRESITITLDELSTYSLGQLLALFERFVGIYANLINVNAYHQPGVEAGKKAAEKVIADQKAILEILATNDKPLTVKEIVESNSDLEKETTFKILRHLAANSRIKCADGETVFDNTYSL